MQFLPFIQSVFDVNKIHIMLKNCLRMIIILRKFFIVLTLLFNFMIALNVHVNVHVHYEGDSLLCLSLNCVYYVGLRSLVPRP